MSRIAAARLVLALAALGCDAPPPRPPVDLSPKPTDRVSVAAPPSNWRSTSVKATSDSRLETSDYHASLIVPAGWLYKITDRGLLIQTEDHGAGVFLFGAADTEAMKTLVDKIDREMREETTKDKGFDDEVTIGGARFARTTYRKSRIKGEPVTVVIGITKLASGAEIAVYAYALHDPRDMFWRLDPVIQSIVVPR